MRLVPPKFATLSPPFSGIVTHVDHQSFYSLEIPTITCHYYVQDVIEGIGSGSRPSGTSILDFALLSF